MKLKRRLFEGSAKILYEGPDSSLLIQHFTDSCCARQNVERGNILGKGVINNRISAKIMERLSAHKIPNHFIRRLNMREQLVHAAEIIPLTLLVRNIAVGDFAERMGVADGTLLAQPIIEFQIKNEQGRASFVSEEHIAAFGWAYNEDLSEIYTLCGRVNDYVTGYCAALGLQLCDLTLEFGRIYNEDEVRIILVDEISPDTMSLRDIEGGCAYDQERVCGDPVRVQASFHDLAQRFGLSQDSLRQESLRIQANQEQQTGEQQQPTSGLLIYDFAREQERKSKLKGKTRPVQSAVKQSLPPQSNFTQKAGSAALLPKLNATGHKNPKGEQDEL